MLTFDPTYFDGEVRDGFYVTSMMKRAWAAQLEVLKEIEKICKKYDLIYFAEFGTMIGAVRHKGFIPWDDDMDIAMSRKDLNEFLKVAEAELPQGYRVLTIDDDFTEFLIRVVNTDSLSISFEHMNRFHGFPFIAGIDIFIYDDLPLDREEEDTMMELFSAVHSLGYNWDNEEMGTMEEKKEVLRDIEKLCNYYLDEKQSYKKQLIQLAYHIASMYQDKKAKEVTILYRFVTRRFYRFPKEYITDIIEVPFENTTIPIPRHYDEILRNVYGDYMKPEIINCGHDYPYYKEQQEMLLEAMKESKVKLPEYFYEETKRE